MDKTSGQVYWNASRCSCYFYFFVQSSALLNLIGIFLYLQRAPEAEVAAASAAAAATAASAAASAAETATAASQSGAAQRQSPTASPALPEESVQQSPSPDSTHESGSLPNGWEVRSAPNGRPFFIDHNTKTTTWVKEKGF